MAWWQLELVTAAVLAVVVGVLGPLIRRFGRAYAGDVFRANPRTGKSYLVLMDFAYYLVFGAYVLFVVQFTRDPQWTATVGGAQLQASTLRIGGLLLLMGLLHGFNVLTLPIVGRLLGLAHTETGGRAADRHARPAGAESGPGPTDGPSRGHDLENDT